jgi:hypothetical protein
LAPLVVLVRVALVVVRREEAPAMPWVRLRWAPSDAGRVNDFPHSGQTSRCARLLRIFVVDPLAVVLVLRRAPFALAVVGLAAIVFSFSAGLNCDNGRRSGADAVPLANVRVARNAK